MNTQENRRNRLEQQKQDVQERLLRVRQDRDPAGTPLSADFADQATEVENDEVLERLEESLLQQLAQIDHALNYLARGGDGHCETCGAPVGDARLTAVPYATQCRGCADGGSARAPLAA